MWSLVKVNNNSSYYLWFSDGEPLNATRGGPGVSSRLIVDRQGFLDLTELDFAKWTILDANGSKLIVSHGGELGPPLELSLKILEDGTFILSLTTVTSQTIEIDLKSSTAEASGRLKPLPEVSAEDATFIDDMIELKYVPYQNIPEGCGKTENEIRVLGQMFFPFSPFSFQLAMCVYDWTTASFTRLVLLKIFEYTKYNGKGQYPVPIDQHSVAQEIWTSNWDPYTAQDPDFMHSFMMKPAWSLLDVELQFMNVRTELHHFSDIENRLLSAAMQALPRTSVFSHWQLFSGQLDIYQLGLDHFGIGFLEYPFNRGPISKPLIDEFQTAITTYISEGKTITTKMVWSFTNSVDHAMHYSNGILLVANHPGDSWVWETAAYITPLSDDPKKTEYTFMPGTQFEVESVNQEATVKNQPVVVITLRPISNIEQTAKTLEIPDEAREGLPRPFNGDEAAHFEAYTPALELPHTRNKTGGRRCTCIDVADTGQPIETGSLTMHPRE